MGDSWILTRCAHYIDHELRILNSSANRNLSWLLENNHRQRGSMEKHAARRYANRDTITFCFYELIILVFPCIHIPSEWRQDNCESLLIKIWCSYISEISHDWGDQPLLGILLVLAKCSYILFSTKHHPYWLTSGLMLLQKKKKRKAKSDKENITNLLFTLIWYGLCPIRSGLIWAGH